MCVLRWLRLVGITALMVAGLSLGADRSHAQTAVDARGDIVFGPETAAIVVVSYISLACPACETWLDVFHAPLLQELEKNRNLRHVIKLIGASESRVEEENAVMAAALTSCADLTNERKIDFVRVWLGSRNDWLNDARRIRAVAMLAGRPLSDEWIDCANGRELQLRSHLLELFALSPGPDDAGMITINYPLSIVGPVVDGKVIVQDRAMSGISREADRLLASIRLMARKGGVD